VSEIEVEAETTTIETETVTVCDHCGTEIDECEVVRIVADPSVSVAETTTYRTLRDAILGAHMVEYEHHGTAWHMQVDPEAVASDIDLEFNSQMEVDVHPDCLEGLFDATPNSEAIQYAALAREATTDSIDDSETDATQKRFPWMPVVGIITTAVLIIGGLVSGYGEFSLIALGLFGSSVFAAAIWFREVFGGD
jgi:hypothetical protein